MNTMWGAQTKAYEAGIAAERERCAGIVRNAVRSSNEMLGRADVEWHQSLLGTVLDGMDPENGKYSLSLQQEHEDAVRAAVMKEQERCASILESYIWTVTTKCGEILMQIADKMRVCQ